MALPSGRSRGEKGSCNRCGLGGCTRLVHSSQAYLQGDEMGEGQARPSEDAQGITYRSIQRQSCLRRHPLPRAGLLGFGQRVDVDYVDSVWDDVQRDGLLEDPAACREGFMSTSPIRSPTQE